MSVRPLLVTVDVECDKGPDWRTQSPLAFAGVALGIGQRLHPLCTSLGLRPKKTPRHARVLGFLSTLAFELGM